MYEKLRMRWRNCGPLESACRGWLQTTLERHWLKTVVVSVEGEVERGLGRYGSRRRAKANHRSGVESNSGDIKTRERSPLWDEPIGNLFTGWVVSGVKVARARSRRVRGTAGTRASM